jgi:hypothetical protein
MLPALNISDSPELEQARLDVKKLIDGMRVDELRDDENKKSRKDAAKALSDITDKMSAFMGAM